MGKAGLLIVDKYRNLRKKCGKEAVSSVRLRRYRNLYPGEDAAEKIRCHDARKVMQAGLFLLAGSLLLPAVWLAGRRKEPVTSLERPECNEAPVVCSLEAVYEESVYPLTISVNERAYTEKEAEEKAQQAMEEAAVLFEVPVTGKREAEDIPLPTRSSDGTFQISWCSENRELYDDWGTLLKEPHRIRASGEDAVFLAELSYGGSHWETRYSVKVFPPELSETQKKREQLAQDLLEAEQSAKNENSVQLPTQKNGEAVVWYVQEERPALMPLILLWIAAGIGILAADRETEKRKLKQRRQQMQADYTELLSKFTVLIRAGLSTRNVWERLVREYEGKKKNGESIHYVYEEMALTLGQLKNGASEGRAYGEFGRRCGLHSYMKFGALLEQNLRQGTTQLAARLHLETQEAFEARKNAAKRAGEEAQTKMMLPLFLMLFVVLAIVMVPAFYSL